MSPVLQMLFQGVQQLVVLLGESTMLFRFCAVVVDLPCEPKPRPQINLDLFELLLQCWGEDLPVLAQASDHNTNFAATSFDMFYQKLWPDCWQNNIARMFECWGVRDRRVRVGKILLDGKRLPLAQLVDVPTLEQRTQPRASCSRRL